MPFNPLLFGEKYRIPTCRLQSHGYGAGFYHIVVCTKDRRCYFGHIENERMFYSVVGQFAKGCIEGLSKYYPYVEILCFQVMPNHIHLLLHLTDAAPTVETVFHTVSQNDIVSQQNIVSQQSTVSQTDVTRRSGLSIVVSGMKRAITMFAKENNIDFGWQPRFYDTIIRSATQYSETNYYIQNNVLHWNEDKMHPDAPNPQENE